jgi:hypothetical protein
MTLECPAFSAALPASASAFPLPGVPNPDQVYGPSPEPADHFSDVAGDCLARSGPSVTCSGDRTRRVRVDGHVLYV